MVIDEEDGCYIPALYLDAIVGIYCVHSMNPEYMPHILTYKIASNSVISMVEQR